MKAFYRGISYDLEGLTQSVFPTQAQPYFRGHAFEETDLSQPAPSAYADAQYRGHKLAVNKQRTANEPKPNSQRFKRTLESLRQISVAH